VLLPKGAVLIVPPYKTCFDLTIMARDCADCRRREGWLSTGGD
jgi:hypothetical protein